jgi:hypothetical protein
MPEIVPVSYLESCQPQRKLPWTEGVLPKKHTTKSNKQADTYRRPKTRKLDDIEEGYDRPYHALPAASSGFFKNTPMIVQFRDGWGRSKGESWSTKAAKRFSRSGAHLLFMRAYTVIPSPRTSANPGIHGLGLASPPFFEARTPTLVGAKSESDKAWSAEACGV